MRLTMVNLVSRVVWRDGTFGKGAYKVAHAEDASSVVRAALLVIARSEATTQSSPRPCLSGLLRFARNDGLLRAKRHRCPQIPSRVIGSFPENLALDDEGEAERRRGAPL